jgi:hypothetical protein
MQQIVVEPGLARTLGEASSQTVVCDPEGRVIGFFSPLPDRPRIEDLQLDSPLTAAEMEELRKKNRTGKPLEEILGRLGL